MGQSTYFWIAVAAATLIFALIDLDALSRRRIGRVHRLSLVAYIASFAVLALAFARTPDVWLFPTAVRLAVVAILIGGRLLAGSVRTGERLMHPGSTDPEEPTDRTDMSSEEMSALSSRPVGSLGGGRTEPA